MGRKAATSITPLGHQDEFLKVFSRELRRGVKRALFVMASGLGKTYASAFATRTFKRGKGRIRVLYLAHQNDILTQAQQMFQSVFGHTFTYGMFNGHAKEASADAVFASFQTMHRELFGEDRNRRRFFGPKRFDFIIVDESHHGHAPTYREVIEYFKPEFLLGMTATPKRADMLDLKEIFGKEIFNLDLATALVSGLLTPVDYRVMADELVKAEKIKVPPHLVSIQMINRVFFSHRRDDEVARLIMEKIRDVQDPRVIVFTASIKHAEEFATLIPGAVTIHSHIPHKERERRMVAVRSGLVRFVVTIDQFNEGVDIPEANVLVFLRSTQSQRVFYQQLGRGLRLHPGKKHVLALDFVANSQRVIFLGQFRQELTAAAEQMNGTRKRRKVTRRGPTHEFHVDWGSVTFEERVEEVVELLRRAQLGLTPEMMLEALRKFHSRTGRLPQATELRAANGLPSRSTYIGAFGSWKAAVQAAGIFQEVLEGGRSGRLTTTWRSNYELLEVLRTFHREHGRAPKETDLKAAKGMPSYPTVVARFGSFAKALEEAGLSDSISKYARGTLVTSRQSNKELLDLLRSLAKRQGKPPVGSDLTNENDMPHPTTYINRFGGLPRALELAGLIPTRQERANAALEQIRTFHRKHGRVPLAAEFLASNGLPSIRLIKSCFGKPSKAIRKAGLHPRKAGHKISEKRSEL